MYFSAVISVWDLVQHIFSHQQDQRDSTPDISLGTLLDSREEGEINQSVCYHSRLGL